MANIEVQYNHELHVKVWPNVQCQSFFKFYFKVFQNNQSSQLKFNNTSARIFVLSQLQKKYSYLQSPKLYNPKPLPISVAGFLLNNHKLFLIIHIDKHQLIFKNKIIRKQYVQRFTQNVIIHKYKGYVLKSDWYFSKQHKKNSLNSTMGNQNI
eukprot:GHVU01056767.1.p1 GENE.GHVU01056767.1~~GHVU01056767.1.p1  ORF type:complete len:153 (-),score=5.67 GHVU01056767.1:1559-2017(-)